MPWKATGFLRKPLAGLGGSVEAVVHWLRCPVLITL